MLADGPAIWLRVMPQQPLDTRLRITDLQRLVPELATCPLFAAYSNVLSVRGGDGAGLCLPLGEGPSPSLVFVFTDGEIWTIDTFAPRAQPQLILLDEQAFTKSLKQCAAFLNDRLNVLGPYRWVAGMEGVKDRSLPLPNDQLGRTRGPCTVDPIEVAGVFTLEQDPATILEPFFEEVFESCGVARRRAAFGR